MREYRGFNIRVKEECRYSFVVKLDDKYERYGFGFKNMKDAIAGARRAIDYHYEQEEHNVLSS